MNIEIMGLDLEIIDLPNGKKSISDDDLRKLNHVFEMRRFDPSYQFSDDDYTFIRDIEDKGEKH